MGLPSRSEAIDFVAHGSQRAPYVIVRDIGIKRHGACSSRNLIRHAPASEFWFDRIAPRHAHFERLDA